MRAWIVCSVPLGSSLRTASATIRSAATSTPVVSRSKNASGRTISSERTDGGVGLMFYAVFFLSAHRAFIMADNFFFIAGLIGFREMDFLAGVAAFFGAALPFCFAHRAFCAAEILARAETLIVRRFGLLAAIALFEPAGRPGPRREGWEPNPARAAMACSILVTSSLSCATML